jgi:hypothetical protein
MDANKSMRLAEAKRAAADAIEAQVVDLKALAEHLRAEADAVEAKEALA